MPSPRPHFDKPPLIEAVFDCFVEPGPETPALAQLEHSVFAKLTGFDGKRQDWQEFQAGFEIKDGQVVGEPSSIERKGVRRWNQARDRGVLISSRVAALNILPPYGHFEEHEPQLQEVLDSYFSTARPARVEWLGHRYINRVEVRLEENLSPGRLFTIYPALPEARAVRHPPMSVQVEHSRFQDSLVLTSLSLTLIDAEKALYTLDVYARTVGNAPSSAVQIVEWHRAAHDAVTDAFLGSITSVARRRFEERAP